MIRVTIVGPGMIEDVLVVDDHPGDRRFIEEAIEASRLDPTVHTVDTRSEALDIVSPERANGSDPDVILLDWNLSTTTGKEVLEAAKSRDPSIPVIVMTGTKAEAESVKSTLPRADTYIEKPTDPEGYIEALCSVVEPDRPN